MNMTPAVWTGPLVSHPSTTCIVKCTRRQPNYKHHKLTSCAKYLRSWLLSTLESSFGASSTITYRNREGVPSNSECHSLSSHSSSYCFHSLRSNWICKLMHHIGEYLFASYWKVKVLDIILHLRVHHITSHHVTSHHITSRTYINTRTHAHAHEGAHITCSVQHHHVGGVKPASAAVYR